MKKIFYTFVFSLLMLFSSCDLLDIKPVNSMLPKSVEDFESVLLGGYPRENFFINTDLATDNVYANLGATSAVTKSYEPWFIWAATHQYNEAEDAYWRQLYQSIFYANTVLDEFAGKTPAADEKSLFETVRGEAYALRAYCYFYLVNLYAENYAAENMEKPGVPMPLSADDVHQNTQNNVRVSVGKVWEQIEKDLEEASKDLSGKESKSKYRFDYISLQAFKARVFLFMGKYEEAIDAASYVIDAKALFDMNEIQSYLDGLNKISDAFSYNYGFIDTDYRNEVLFFVGGKANGNPYYYYKTRFKPTEELLNLCKRDPGVVDYRRYIFESNADPASGDYVEQGPTVYRMYATQQSDCYYIGMKLSEAYVTRAEAYARTGEKDLAIDDLNRLLVTRIKKTDYVALDKADFTAETALQRVLEERRVELAFDGGLRWFDLRRLGKPGIQHAYERGEVYTLNQGDLRYVLQIPLSEQLNSPSMPLNPR